MCCDLFMRSDLTLDPSFKVKQGSTIFKGLKRHLLLVLEVWHVKPTYRKECAGGLFMGSDLTFDPLR